MKYIIALLDTIYFGLILVFLSVFTWVLLFGMPVHKKNITMTLIPVGSGSPQTVQTK